MAASPAEDLCLHASTPLGMAPSCPKKQVLSPGQSSRVNQELAPAGACTSCIPVAAFCSSEGCP